MKSQRLNKEYTLDTNNQFVLKIGVTNKNSPNVFYVTGKVWVGSDNGVEADAKNHVRATLRRGVNSFLTSVSDFDNKFILDFDFNDEGINEAKRKYCSFEFFVKQNKNIKDLKVLKEELADQLVEMTTALSKSFEMNNYRLYKKKIGA